MAKDKITLEEIISIERAARRQIEIERGMPHSKTGVHTDRKKKASREKCRGKATQDGW